MTALAPQRTETPKPFSAFRYMSFDVVGTLIDFETAIAEGLQAPAAEAGVTLDMEQVYAAYLGARSRPDAPRCPDDLAYCYGAIAASLGLPDTPAYRAAMVEAVAESRPFPDSVEALGRLREHFKLIAMTNARRWGFERYEQKLGNPFWAGFTSDDTGAEKPNPAFFHAVFDHVARDGGSKDDILHTAQSQYHDMAVSRSLGMTNCWIERRHAENGWGGTPAPQAFTVPDYHFHSMRALADAVDAAAR
ncbi:HAD-IA family hydrolase [Phaeovulum sp. W22_SRMD_FR3]|uniref:HAD-IA family hydrolase n=1 Tax=Phaeovulum sp. W22_SRMD_FR3 TaxID=3240274 RepID=UPI003F9900CF